jgi:hypothetical protein
MGEAVGHEANHSPPSSAQVKNGGDIPPSSHIHLYIMVWHQSYAIINLFNEMCAENVE